VGRDEIKIARTWAVIDFGERAAIPPLRVGKERQHFGRDDGDLKVWRLAKARALHWEFTGRGRSLGLRGLF